MTQTVNVFVPLLLFVIIIGLSGIVNRWLGDKFAALALTFSSVMIVPFILAAILQRSILVGIHIYTAIIAVIFIFYFIKSGKSKDLLSIFDKNDFWNIVALTIIALGPLLPGLWGNGYFITNPNFDFIYQSVDARYMVMHDPTVFNPLLGNLQVEDLPLNWSANQQGRYLSSVVQALISIYFFNGLFLEGSVSSFIYFYFCLIISLYIFFSAFITSKRNVLLATVLALTSVYGWAPVRFMLIGQLSSISIFILLIGGFAQLLSKNEIPKYTKFLPLALTLGSLTIIYFALGFFAICIAILLFLACDAELKLKDKISPLVLILTIVALVYFIPYLTKPHVIIDVIYHWFEVIFSKMYSSKIVDEVAVEYLGEFIGLRMLGLDPIQLGKISVYLVNPKSNLYIFAVLIAFSCYCYITYFAIRLNTKNHILVKVTWIFMSGSVFLFFITQSGYLVFKSLTYLFFVPPLVYFILLESKNLGNINKLIIGVIALTVGFFSFIHIYSLTEDILSDNPSSKFGTGVGMSGDYIQLLNYLRSISPEQKVWIALPTPNQQGYVLLGSNNFRDRGIGQNYQVLENARWSSRACEEPKISSTDLVVIPSRFAPTVEAANNPKYSNPNFENSQYAVVEFKKLHKLVVFSRGFYAPEQVKLPWNSTFEAARWSTGKSAILVYSDSPINGMSGKVLTYGDLKLTSTSIDTGGILLQGMPKFQNLTLKFSSKGWTCIEFTGETNFNKPQLNRWIFTSRPTDPRPIKFLFGGGVLSDESTN